MSEYQQPPGGEKRRHEEAVDIKGACVNFGPPGLANMDSRAVKLVRLMVREEVKLIAASELHQSQIDAIQAEFAYMLVVKASANPIRVQGKLRGLHAHTAWIIDTRVFIRHDDLEMVVWGLRWLHLPIVLLHLRENDARLVAIAVHLLAGRVYHLLRVTNVARIVGTGLRVAQGAQLLLAGDFNDAKLPKRPPGKIKRHRIDAAGGWNGLKFAARSYTIDTPGMRLNDHFVLIFTMRVRPTPNLTGFNLFRRVKK